MTGLEPGDMEAMGAAGRVRERVREEAPVLETRAAWGEGECFCLGHIVLDVLVGPQVWNSGQNPGLRSSFGRHWCKATMENE